MIRKVAIFITLCTVISLGMIKCSFGQSSSKLCDLGTVTDGLSVSAHVNKQEFVIGRAVTITVIVHNLRNADAIISDSGAKFDLLPEVTDSFGKTPPLTTEGLAQALSDSSIQRRVKVILHSGDIYKYTMYLTAYYYFRQAGTYSAMIKSIMPDSTGSGTVIVRSNLVKFSITAPVK